MKRFLLGTLFFVAVLLFALITNNFSVSYEVSGVLGLIGMLAAGFFKTGFSGGNSPALGNSAIIELDKKYKLSSTLFLLAFPNLLGSIILLILS